MLNTSAKNKSTNFQCVQMETYDKFQWKFFKNQKNIFFKKRTTLCDFIWNCKKSTPNIFLFVIELWFWFWFKRKRKKWIVTTQTNQRSCGLLNFQADTSWVNIRFVFTSLIFFLRIQIQQKLLKVVSFFILKTHFLELNCVANLLWKHIFPELKKLKRFLALVLYQNHRNNSMLYAQMQM